MLSNIYQKLEGYYAGLINHIDITHNIESIDIPEKNELYTYAIEYFNEKNDIVYKELTLNLIDSIDIFSNVRRRKRRIVGVILQRYLKSKETKNIPKIDTLSILYNQIINDVLQSH